MSPEVEGAQLDVGPEAADANDGGEASGFTFTAEDNGEASAFAFSTGETEDNNDMDSAFDFGGAEDVGDADAAADGLDSGSGFNF